MKKWRGKWARPGRNIALGMLMRETESEGGRRREGVERCPLSPLVSRVNGKSIIRIRGQSAKKYTRCYNFKRNAALKFFNDRRCTHSSTLFTTQSDYIPTLFSTPNFISPLSSPLEKTVWKIYYSTIRGFSVQSDSFLRLILMQETLRNEMYSNSPEFELASILLEKIRHEVVKRRKKNFYYFYLLETWANIFLIFDRFMREKSDGVNGTLASPYARGVSSKYVA